MEVCAVVPPAGYVLNNTDCDDNDAAVNALSTLYQDADGDGLGNPAVSQEFCGTGQGWVDNNNDANDIDFDNDGVSTPDDCNDQDANISDNQIYYRDNDGDGLGDPNNYLEVCSYTVPAGYVTNSDDLDDNDNGQVEDVVTAEVVGRYLHIYVNGVEVASRRVFWLTPTGSDVGVVDYYNDGVHEIIVTGVYFGRIAKIISFQFDGNNVNRVRSRYLWLSNYTNTASLTLYEDQNTFDTLFNQSLFTWQIQQNGNF